jgi:signal transduction histidine kinase
LKTGKTGPEPAKKYQIDTKGLKFKLTLYFLLFAVALMAVLWLLQIAFMDAYYESSMKRQVRQMVESVSRTYAYTPELDVEDLCLDVAEMAYGSDTYLYLETADGLLRITSSADSETPGRMFMGGARERDKARELIQESSEKTVLFYVEGSRSGSRTLVYGTLSESAYREDLFIYAFAPVYPVDATVRILASQLLLVTAASLLLAVILALWLSGRLSRPLIQIKNSAEQLARGDYDVPFRGGGYTEIDELATTLTRTAQELSKADELQKDLLANVSHDLRTPLTMVKSYAELIRDISGEDPEKRTTHLGVIIEEADRLDGLVGDILTLSKIQSGVEIMELRPTDLVQLAEHTIATFRVLEELDEYRFDLEAPPGPVWARGDGRRLSQVLHNLIANAVRYSPEEKVVRVTVAEEGDRVRVSVEDRGIGIPASELQSIWDRYHRASRQGSRALSGGSGLGLSISREILQLHGASYGVESTEGRGSRFWFALARENRVDRVKPV